MKTDRFRQNIIQILLRLRYIINILVLDLYAISSGNSSFLSVENASTSVKLLTAFCLLYFYTKRYLIMKRIGPILIIFLLWNAAILTAQQDSTWTLEKCINYALQQNIQVRKTTLNNQRFETNATQARAQRYPSVNGSIGQNFSWSKNDQTTGTGFTGSNGSSYSVSSGVVIFNAKRLTNLIKQSDLDIEGGVYRLETTKESISLSILDAYLQILYAEEQVKNSE